MFSPDNQKIFFSDLDEKSHRDVVGSVDRRGEHRAAVWMGIFAGCSPTAAPRLMLDRETDWVLYQPATRVQNLFHSGTTRVGRSAATARRLFAPLGPAPFQYDVAAAAHSLDGPPGWVRAISPCKDGFLIVARGQGERMEVSTSSTSESGKRKNCLPWKNNRAPSPQDRADALTAQHRCRVESDLNHQVTKSTKEFKKHATSQLVGKSSVRAAGNLACSCLVPLVSRRFKILSHLRGIFC